MAKKSSARANSTVIKNNVKVIAKIPERKQAVRSNYTRSQASVPAKRPAMLKSQTTTLIQARASFTLKTRAPSNTSLASKPQPSISVSRLS